MIFIQDDDPLCDLFAALIHLRSRLPENWTLVGAIQPGEP